MCGCVWVCVYVCVGVWVCGFVGVCVCDLMFRMSCRMISVRMRFSADEFSDEFSADEFQCG